MRRRWKAATAAVALAFAAALGGISPAVSQAEPAAAAKDFSKPAIVILGYGLNPDGTMRTILRRRVLTGLMVAQFFPQSPIIVTGGNPQNGKTEAGQMRNMLQLLGFPGNRIIVEDKANSTVQNARFSVPLAREADTSGIILVTSTTHQGRADGDFADAGGNLLATVSYPDGNPSVNVAQFARDAISPFVNVVSSPGVANRLRPNPSSRARTMASGAAASSRSIALAISLLGGGRQGRVKSGSTPEKTAKKLRLLVDAGVDSIVDLTTPDDHLESYLEALQLIAENAGRQVRHYAHPIPDNSVIDYQG